MFDYVYKVIYSKKKVPNTLSYFYFKLKLTTYIIIPFSSFSFYRILLFLKYPNGSISRFIS